MRVEAGCGQWCFDPDSMCVLPRGEPSCLHTQRTRADSSSLDNETGSPRFPLCGAETPDFFSFHFSTEKNHRLYPASFPSLNTHARTHTQLSNKTRLQCPNEREVTTETIGECRLAAEGARNGTRLCQTGSCRTASGLPWQRCLNRSQLVCLPLFYRRKIKDG